MKSRAIKQWYIQPSSAPLYLRRCSKCKKVMPFYCSGKFRVNAQKRVVDVWLIYKCVKCDNTFNVDVLSRVNPELIDDEEYSSFQNNDNSAAWRYAFNPHVINKNKVKVDYSKIEYIKDGDLLSLDDILEQPEDLIVFNVNIKYDIDVSLSSIVRKNFNISAAQLEKMLSSGVATFLPPGTVKNSKINDKQSVVINKAKLKQFLTE